MIKIDGGYERIQLVIPKDVLERVEKARGKERRNRSNMIVVLLDEALAAREKAAEGKEPGNSEELERAA